MSDTLKIVIVDDEPITKQALRYIIQGIPEFEIVGEASNGEEGLQVLETCQPDVIISDIVMPTMDGLDFSQIVRSAYPDIDIIVLSGYNQFDYVRTAFQLGITDYILKPNLEPDLLQNKLLQIAKQRGLHFSGTSIYKLSDETILAYLLEQAEEIDRPYLSEYFAGSCFLLVGGTLPSRDSSTPNEEYLLKRIRESFDRIPPSHPYYSMVHWERESVFLLFQEEQENAQALTDRLVHFLSTSPDGFITSLFWTYSEVYWDILQSGTAANKVERSLQKGFYYPTCHLIPAVEEPQEMAAGISHSTYIQYLSGKQVAQAEQLLLEYLLTMKEHKSADARDLKKEVDSLIYNAFSVLFPQHTESVHRLKLKSFAQIDQSDNIDLLIASVEEIFASFATVLQVEQTAPTLYQEIFRYLETNYAQPLTLHSIAGEFHISYSYLSSYFNAVGGSSFNEQLNQIRIQHAENLLLSSDYSIAEISQMVGYSEQSYFGKIFKAQVGESPSRYRRYHQSESEGIE